MMVDVFYKIVFLGGMLLESQSKQIESNAKANVQHAADALQKAMLRGIAAHQTVAASVVNVPFIAPFPLGDRTVWFPATLDILFDKIPVNGMGFLNLMVARLFDRFRAAFRGIREETTDQSDCILMVYSAHLPFLIAALAIRGMRTGIRICLILPDFPEFMRQGNLIYRIFAQLNRKIFYKLVPRVDYFVLITAAMATRLKISPEKYTVVEGIYDPISEVILPSVTNSAGLIFIYTGTLAAQYGILDLLIAFSQLEQPYARLWICGDGDAQSAVEVMARRDPRVIFFGRLPRSEALALQAQAHIMVNPRRPEGEFTRYSFPSKTMEYLASGRPVLMHWLPGIPEEYRPYLITPETGDADGLALTMQRVAALPDDELRRIGAAGRDFVLQHKNPRAQVARILDGLYPQRLSNAVAEG
jgi:glycosyltransferase involved in cell wall biosynthesis